jgi:CubicO group peptidase (beta-lactamase class C family)
MNANRYALFLLMVSGLVTASPAQQAPHHSIDMTVAKPESVGFSSERLERLHAVMKQTVDNNELSGMVTILARHGKVVDYWSYGKRDVASGAPMAKDTIFRDFSMTKPVTGVAMMMLYEQGKWLPSEPISKYIPEFAHLKVYKGMDAEGKMILVDPDHAPTMGELMTHTAGFTYGYFGDTPVDHMYRDAKLFEAKDLKEFVDKLAAIPLLYQPGKGWVYSVSMDVQGYIVEKLSGKSFSDFLRENIFQPLGMKDAGFYVPADKRSRFAAVYTGDDQGKMVPVTTKGMANDYSEQPGMASGGGGMVSTAEDYYRFAQMLLDKGELDGKRILAPGTVKLMTSNHLPPSLLTGEWGIGDAKMKPGFGWGYDCAVESDPQKVDMPDGKGTFTWSGAAGTWFWVDPENEVVFIGMDQRMLMGKGFPPVFDQSRALVYQALVNPEK